MNEKLNKQEKAKKKMKTEKSSKSHFNVKTMFYGILLIFAIISLFFVTVPVCFSFYEGILLRNSWRFSDTSSIHRNFVAEVAWYEVEHDREFSDGELNFFLRILTLDRKESKVKTYLQFVNRELVGEISIESCMVTRKTIINREIDYYKAYFMKERNWIPEGYEVE